MAVFAAPSNLIVLGILKRESLSAYDIQKLEEKGFIKSRIEKEGKMPEKAVYSLTRQGEQEFEKLMLKIAAKSIHIFLDFNAVIVNLDSLSQEKQNVCVANIENNIKQLKSCLEENFLAKENIPDVPENGMAVLQQQLILARAIETWISSLKKNDGDSGLDDAEG